MILIVDDDNSIRSSLTFLLTRAKYEPYTASSPKEAIEFVRQNTPQLILMDMNYSLTTTGEEGIFLLKQVKVFCPSTPVILMTAWGSIQLAVEGMRAGAFDFITKPWNNIMLLKTIQTAIEINNPDRFKHNIVLENIHGNNGENPAFVKIIGESKGIKEILKTVERIAKTNASVLITGESGTGKELIAEAVHNASLRAQAPFVKVNLGGISQNLFESEMFGHKKGAFTDAYSNRVGRFKTADTGTIFLDEIGDLDINCQVKLLRVLQDQTFEVLGESKMQKVDVRVVCATNRNLQQMVADHTFREDLLYRINLIPINLPPLRERVEDIPMLARYFAHKMWLKYIDKTNNIAIHSTNMVDFTKEAMTYLQRLPYLGNIRELKNLIERTILVTGKELLGQDDFEKQYYALHSNENILPHKQIETLENLEKISIEKAMLDNDNNITKASRALGISRAALYRRLEKYK
ncbi:MAG: sigma-54 dependent transcriptional regulator [Bacteroidales bacterium]